MTAQPATVWMCNRCRRSETMFAGLAGPAGFPRGWSSVWVSSTDSNPAFRAHLCQSCTQEHLSFLAEIPGREAPA